MHLAPHGAKNHFEILVGKGPKSLGFDLLVLYIYSYFIVMMRHNLWTKRRTQANVLSFDWSALPHLLMTIAKGSNRSIEDAISFALHPALIHWDSRNSSSKCGFKTSFPSSSCKNTTFGTHTVDIHTLIITRNILFVSITGSLKCCCMNLSCYYYYNLHYLSTFFVCFFTSVRMQVL